MKPSLTSLTAGLLLVSAPNLAMASKSAAPMFTRSVEACVIPAANYHKVNHYVLWAILKVESNFKPATVTKNSNGTQDHGMGGMNTIHMPTLSKHGVNEENIKDPCISTYVTAWHLSKEIAKHGNTWFGVAAYHSVTPYFNNRYQIMLKNALIDAGVISDMKQPVPPLKRSSGQSTPSYRATPTMTQAKNAANLASPSVIDD